MKLHSPSMSELHAFAEAARLGSFTLAARKLCVTQGAISRAVARLESHFGQALLQRNAHRIALTEAGRQLLADIAAPLAAIESASQRLAAAGRTAQLTLAVVPTLASAWLVPRLPDFHRRHPDIALSFVPYRRDEDFSGSTPDAALLVGAGNWPGWSSDYVIGHQLVPICHPARLQARRAAGQWNAPADLLAEPLLYHTTAPNNWTEWFQQVGAGEIKPALANGFDQVSILVQAVIADMGVALVQRCLITETLDAQRVAMPFDIPVKLSRGYYLCTPPQRREMPALKIFRDWLLDMARADLEQTGGVPTVTGIA